MTGTAHQPLAKLVWIVRRLLQMDDRSADILGVPAVRRATRDEVLDAVFRTLLPIREVAPTARRTPERGSVLRAALGLMELPSVRHRRTVSLSGSMAPLVWADVIRTAYPYRCLG